MKITLLLMGLGISWLALALLKEREMKERKSRQRPVVAYGKTRP